MAPKKTVEERRAQREAKRAQNQANWIVTRFNQVKTSGHQRVKVACAAALAVSRRVNEDARKALAAEIAAAAQRYDAPEFRKEAS